jgi:hypothetical protein
MLDPIQTALEMLDEEAPKKGVTALPSQHPDDIRRRSYDVPTMNNRRQLVHAAPIQDALFGERLDLFSTAMRDLPLNAQLLVGLLAAARDFRRARICVFDPHRPALSVVASFVPNELHEGAGTRLLHALREVAAIADSLEGQLTGSDVE